jgi:hypothetical protein
MVNYLTLLKARSGKKHVPGEPPKLRKPGFVSFDSDPGRHFSQATNASDQTEGGPAMDYPGRLKARSSPEDTPEEPPKLTEPGFVSFGGAPSRHVSQVTNAAASVRSSPSNAVMAPQRYLPAE